MSTKFYFLWTILTTILLVSLSTGGQNFASINSLQKVNTTGTDPKNRVNNYLSIAQEFSHHQNDSAVFYINKAVKLGEKIAFKAGLAEAYFMLSYHYDLRANYPKSIRNLENAIKLFEEIGDSSYLSGCYNNLGVLYSYGENQKKSLEYFIKSIYTGEAAQDSFSLAESYSNVAGFYEDLKEYSSALKYFRKALSIDIRYNYPEDVAVTNLDVAYMNTKLLRYDEALINLNKAQTLLNDVSDPYYQIVLYQQLANYYNEVKRLSDAEKYINKAQKITNKFDYPMLKAETLFIRGEIFLNQKKYKNSIAAIDSAIVQYKSLNSKTPLKELYEKKADAYSGLGYHNKAYTYLQLAKEEEKLIPSNKIAEILGEFEKVEALKEERAQIKLEQELEYQKNENKLIKVKSKLYYTIYLAILLGAILVLALYLFFIKQKHNKSLESSYELINHQKELIEKSYNELKENEKGLAQLNATKDKFFSIIAHDLKNPFNTLIGISELMISEPDIKHTDDFEELLQGMFQTAQAGHDLLENLLEWSRSQIGNIQLNQKTISLIEVFNSISIFFETTAKAKNITITVNEMKDKYVFADSNMVNFIIRNLVSNAIKFSNKGSRIEISVSTKDEFQEICIKDYGIGMTETTLNKLFKIEHSIQQNGTNDERGTGLGLILCKEFVEKNKGEIWVESTPGEGSCFCVSLPLSTDY